jgi:protein-tyrosine-phosphatase
MTQLLPKKNSIAVVCRANEVRSRIAESYLNYRLPGYDVKSFGYDVDINQKVSSTLIRDMGTWGIEVSASRPEPFQENIDFLRQSRFILSADAETADKLAEYGFSSHNICEFALDSFHIPVDPIGLSWDKILANAAKVLHCSARFVSQIVERDINPPLSVLFLPIDSQEKISIKPGTCVIDSRLRTICDPISLTPDYRYIDESEIFDGSLSANLRRDTRLYMPQFEFRHPERMLISKEWRTFTRRVADLGPLIVITTHTATKTRDLWDPYLASILADSVEFR